MKRALILFCCMQLALAEDDQVGEADHRKTVIEQTIVQTIINQQFTKPEKHPFHLFGKKLNTYLNNLDTRTFKEFFPLLPLRAKIMYMLTVTPLQYELFLERYTNDEWANFWHSLSSDEQKHIPKTRVEQLEMIRDGYYAYLTQHKSMFYPYFNPKSPYPSDIGTFKKEFYKDSRVSSYINDFSLFIDSAKNIYLDAYMFRKRYELFNL